MLEITRENLGLNPTSSQNKKMWEPLCIVLGLNGVQPPQLHSAYVETGPWMEECAKNSFIILDTSWIWGLFGIHASNFSVGTDYQGEII